MKLPNRYTRVTLSDSKLTGKILGYTVQQAIGYGEEPIIFAIVELDPECRGWIRNVAFISRMLVHVDNLIW